MNNLLGDNNIVIIIPSWDEAGLVMINELIKVQPQVVSKRLSQDFIIDIAKTNGSKLTNRGRILDPL